MTSSIILPIFISRNKHSRLNAYLTVGLITEKSDLDAFSIEIYNKAKPLVCMEFKLNENNAPES